MVAKISWNPQEQRTKNDTTNLPENVQQGEADKVGSMVLYDIYL
jgi:hypothetical protein